MKTKALAAVIMLFLLTTLKAENINGSLKGKVIDKTSKQAIPGVIVKVVGKGLGAITDNEGCFSITNFPENVYQVEFRFVGYETFVENSDRVTRNKITYLREIQLNESVLQSKEVTVPANVSGSKDDFSVSSFTYTKEEIDRTPGAAGDIFRAVETLRGVSSIGGEFASFTVRGGGPKENIILVDGIPFSKVTHFEEGGGDKELTGILIERLNCQKLKMKSALLEKH